MEARTVPARLDAPAALDLRTRVAPETSVAKLAGDGWTIALVTLTVVGATAAIAFVGADARWLAALGGLITNRGAIPAGVPFASAPTAHWPNTIVLAEVIFHWLQAAFGARGLVLAQLGAVAIAVATLARDAVNAGARRQAAAAATLLACAGALQAVAVARAQLFSLALFPVLVALLRSDARQPSRRIWLVVPLFVVWSNLHGAVLIGLAITGIYLALIRLPREPKLTIAVGLASLLALCLTPAGVRTPVYYYGVLTNEAAKQGQGLWAPLSLTAPLDLLLIGAAIALAVRLRPRSLPRWELVATLVLAALTVQAARSGVWLLFFLVAPAALTLKARPIWNRLLPPLGVVALLALTLAIGRGSLSTGASSGLVSRAVALAHGGPVLAEDLQAEQIALAGGRVWVSNPIDAFAKPVQSAYLDWSAGRPSGAHVLTRQIRVVVTARGSAAEKLMARQRAYERAGHDKTSEIYLRRP